MNIYASKGDRNRDPKVCLLPRLATKIDTIPTSVISGVEQRQEI
jgi:hypothetical protein